LQYLILSSLVSIPFIVFARRQSLRMRELQRQLLLCDEQLLQLKQRQRQRIDFINVVAHEIRNPLTALLCSADALDLMLRDSIAAPHRQSLRYMREYGGQLLRLVNDFFELTKAEAGVLSAKPELVLLANELSAVAGGIHATAKEKGIELQQEACDPSLQVAVDPKHLRQILFNLLHNAIKFTPEGGLVKLGVREDLANSQAEIWVRDTGAGIAPDQLLQMFDLYVRGAQHLSQPGAGIGLALCKRLVELSGGSISVRSQQGEGSEFVLRLPCEHCSAPISATAEANVADQPLQGQRFLLVDQDLGARESLATLLRALGGVVDCASKTQEVLSALNSQLYSTVLVDRTSDGVECTELVRLVRSQPMQAQAKVITAGEYAQDQLSARSTSAQPKHPSEAPDAELSKPLNCEQLLRTLELCAMPERERVQKPDERR
jgi:signal transduction histidine kinase